MTDVHHNLDCQPDQIAAYLDGELNASALADLEAHLKTCDLCKTELLTQRQLLCTLNAAFGSGFDLPENFTRVVKAHAESNIAGLRNKRERGRAVKLAALLALASFGLLGTAWQGSILQPSRSIARIAVSLADLAWRTLYDATTGLMIVLRLLGQAVVLSPYHVGLFLLIVFVVGISLLPHLIAKYHRAQTIE